MNDISRAANPNIILSKYWSHSVICKMRKMSRCDFVGCLRKHRVEGFSYPAFFLDGDRAGVIDVRSDYTNQDCRIGVFKTKEDESRSVFDIRILPGPGHDVTYLTASNNLQKALEAENIPFTDQRNPQLIYTRGKAYEQKLAKALTQYEDKNKDV